MALNKGAAAEPGGVAVSPPGDRRCMQFSALEDGAKRRESGNRAIKLAVAAAQTAARAVASPAPCARRLTENVDLLIDLAFLPLASRPMARSMGKNADSEGAPKKRRRSRDGGRGATCVDGAGGRGGTPGGDRTQRRKVSLSALWDPATEEDSSGASDGGSEAAMHSSSGLHRAFKRTDVPASSMQPTPASGAPSPRRAVEKEETGEPPEEETPVSGRQRRDGPDRSEGDTEARIRLSLFARHPAAWGLSLRALEKAASVLSRLECLRDEDLASRRQLLSSLREEIALFSDSPVSSTGDASRDFGGNASGHSSKSSASKGCLLPESRNAEHTGGVGEAQTRGGFVDASENAFCRNVREELTTRLSCRALFAARLLRLLANAGLPFLQLPLPPPRLRAARRHSSQRMHANSLLPEASDRERVDFAEEAEDAAFEISPSLCFGGETPLHVNQEGVQTPTGGRQEGGFSFRVSPFVPLSLAPPPLASPQLLHRELAALLRLCCLFTSLSLASPALKLETEASAGASSRDKRRPGERAGTLLGGRGAKPGSGEAETPLWDERFGRATSETLYEATAALLAHIVTQQQLDGGTSVPLLQQKTGLQRVVSLLRLFCISGAETGSLSSLSRSGAESCETVPAREEAARTQTSLFSRAVFARVCVGLVRALAQLAMSPATGGRVHLASAEHRALFRLAFLRESPLLLLLLQEAVSVAFSLVERDASQRDTVSLLGVCSEESGGLAGRQFETPHQGTSPPAEPAGPFQELLVVALETTRQILQFWERRLASEMGRRSPLALHRSEDQGATKGSTQCTGPRGGPPGEGAKRQGDGDRQTDANCIATVGEASGSERGEKESNSSSGEKDEEKGGVDLSRSSSEQAYGLRVRRQGSGDFFLEQDVRIEGVVAALVVGDGEIVRRLVRSLLLLLEAIPGIATPDAVPGSSSPPSGKLLLLTSSSRPFLSSNRESRVHALASEVVALLFSLSSSFFFLAPPSPLPRPPLRKVYVSGCVASLSPSSSPSGSESSSARASRPLLSIASACEMPAGDLSARIEAAAREAPPVLPRLLLWLQMAVGRNLSQVTARLLPMLRQASPRLALSQRRALRLLLLWIFPLSRQLAPSLLAAHLLGEASLRDSATKKEEGSRARGGASSPADLGKRGKEKGAKHEKPENGDSGLKGWGLGENAIFALSTRLNLPVVGCVSSGEETAGRGRQGPETPRKSVGATRDGRADAAISRRRSRSSAEDREKTEANAQGRDSDESTDPRSGTGEHSSPVEWPSPPILIILRFLAHLQRVNGLDGRDAFTAVEALSLFLSPFHSLLSSSPFETGEQTSVSLCSQVTEDLRPATREAGLSKRESAKETPRGGRVEVLEGAEGDGRNETLVERKIRESLCRTLNKEGLLPELLDAVLRASMLPSCKSGADECRRSGGDQAETDRDSKGAETPAAFPDCADASCICWEPPLQQRELCRRFLSLLVFLCAESLVPSLTKVLRVASAIPAPSASSSAARRRGEKSQDTSSPSGDKSPVWAPVWEPYGLQGEEREAREDEQATFVEIALWACRQARDAATMCGLLWPPSPQLHAVAVDLLGIYRQRKEEEERAAGRSCQPEAENAKGVSGPGNGPRPPAGAGRRYNSGDKAAGPQALDDRSCTKRGRAPEQNGKHEEDSLLKSQAACWRLLPFVGAAACLGDAFWVACGGPQPGVMKREPDSDEGSGSERLSGAASLCDIAQHTLTCTFLVEDVVQAEDRLLDAPRLCWFLWREIRRVLLDALVLLNAELLAAQATTQRVDLHSRETRREAASPLRPSSLTEGRESMVGREAGRRSDEKGREETRVDMAVLRRLQFRLRRVLLLIFRDLQSFCTVPFGDETTLAGRFRCSRSVSLLQGMQLLHDREACQDEQLVAAISASLYLLDLWLTDDSEKTQPLTKADRGVEETAEVSSQQPHDASSPSNSWRLAVSAARDTPARGHDRVGTAATAPWLWGDRGDGGRPGPGADGEGEETVASPFADLVAREEGGEFQRKTEERVVARQVSLHFMALRGWLLASKVTQTNREMKPLDLRARQAEKRRSGSPSTKAAARRASSRLSFGKGERRESAIPSLWNSQIHAVQRLLFHGDSFPEALQFASASAPSCLTHSSFVHAASDSAPRPRDLAPAVRSEAKGEGKQTLPQSAGNVRVAVCGRNAGRTGGASLTLLAAVWRALALAFSSLSHQFVPAALPGRRASPSGLGVRTRPPETARNLKLHILRGLSNFMVQCAFSPLPSPADLPGSASSSAAAVTFEMGKESGAADEGEAETVTAGEKGERKQKSSDAVTQVDMRRSATVLTAGLLPLIHSVGSTSPACACGAEERTVLLDTVLTFLRSLLDQVATTRLHPRRCFCCSCQGLAASTRRKGEARSLDPTKAGPLGDCGRKGGSPVGVLAPERGEEGKAGPGIAAPAGAQAGLSGVAVAELAEKGSDLRKTDETPAERDIEPSAQKTGERGGREREVQEREEKDLECRLCGGCCHDCAKPLVASLTKARVLWSSVLEALLACFDFPLLLLPLLNERKGFSVLQKLIHFLLQGGLRALQMAVRESRQTEAVLSASQGSREAASCHASARLAEARNGRAELERAWDRTLEWLGRLVHVSRKTAPSCFSKTLDVSLYGGACTRACRRPRALEARTKAKRSENCGPRPPSPRASCCAAETKRARLSEDKSGRAGRGEPEDAHPAAEDASRWRSQAGTKGRVRCSSCGDWLSDGADEDPSLEGQKTDDSEEELESDSEIAGCAVDPATLAWTIEESCARAATALLQHRTKVPLSRVLRQELLLRLGFSALTQDALLRHPLRGLYSVPPTFSFAFPGQSPPAPGGTVPLVGRSPEAIAVASWAPPPLQPPGTQGPGATGASGCIGGSVGQQPQAVLLGLQQHQALQSMEEQMVRTLEIQQMTEGIAEENEGTDGGPPTLVEILLHTVCSLLFATRGEMTPVETVQWSSLFGPLSGDSQVTDPPRSSRGAWEGEADRSRSRGWEFGLEDRRPLRTAGEVEERGQLLLFAMLEALLLPPAARAFSKSGSSGDSFSAGVNDLAFPSQSGPAGPTDAQRDKAEGTAGAYEPVRCGLTVPPRLQLRRWPFVFTFHLLAGSCLPLWGAHFLRRSAFASCCPCCPALESKGSANDSERSPCMGERASPQAASLPHPGHGSDVLAAPASLEATKNACPRLHFVHSWCACCYCFPQPHSPCIKALTMGNSSLAFVPPAPIAAAASAVAGVAARLAPALPGSSRSSTRAVEALGVLPGVGLSSLGGERTVSIDREEGRASVLVSETGDLFGTQLESEPPCAPASLAVFVSALVAAAFKPHLFSLLDTNASYATNMWDGNSAGALSSIVGYGGSGSGGKGERGDGVGTTATPATSRGPAASAAVSSASEQSNTSQALQLPYLLHSPPTFLLHPLQEILLAGLPPRFSSLFVGVQAPQPSIVPPIARVAAAVGQALQFTATHRPAEASCQVREPACLDTCRPGAFFSLLEEFHKCFFAVDFLRVGALLQQQQLLHRHRQLDSLVAMGRGAVGGVGLGSPSCEGDAGSPRGNGLSSEAEGLAALAAGIGAAAAAGDVLALLRLMAPVKPVGTGPASSPSSKETVTGKGAAGGKRGGIGAAGGAFGHGALGGAAGDQPRKVPGGKGKGKR
ncbi:conserved hypothetical protein [Neospora caninum Liverpool]|uniref:Uncharacterized protein n=1 Tax=Neospora caninum (strain Liverpool) TaxID=572307 RepID=F0VLS5_NEOCL|nr:conserved hypothetical protein [Neospora caninum Liverpool]CBZ54203.1 conserved hypothetical protein [Neospora caninum Liverpool]CEL68903.1 TPA: hypothetical protein BN1204_046360 [Neospora caninum Liverpool]|eukprot:XP_003884234.1 conserved hypothetical protein [Neospora caninum Liverpool]